MVPILYFLMLACFVTHELDATKRREWRVLPLLSVLSEKTGEQVFIWLHVPLFFLLFYFGGFDPFSAVAKGLSAFAVIHVGLHWLLRNHPKTEFNNVSSWLLIAATGVFGTVHLIVA